MASELVISDGFRTLRTHRFPDTCEASEWRDKFYNITTSRDFSVTLRSSGTIHSKADERVPTPSQALDELVAERRRSMGWY